MQGRSRLRLGLCRGAKRREYSDRDRDALVHWETRPRRRRNYEAYLTDPLALPANVDKVKKKLAS